MFKKAKPVIVADDSELTQKEEGPVGGGTKGKRPHTAGRGGKDGNKKPRKNSKASVAGGTSAPAVSAEERRVWPRPRSERLEREHLWLK